MDEDNETQNYFTKELNKKIAELPEKQMWVILRELEQTPYWLAILKYHQERTAYAQGVLATTDPIEKPALIARTQGIMAGISDLENAVIQLVQKEEEERKEKEEDNKA